MMLFANNPIFVKNLMLTNGKKLPVTFKRYHLEEILKAISLELLKPSPAYNFLTVQLQPNPAG